MALNAAAPCSPLLNSCTTNFGRVTPTVISALVKAASAVSCNWAHLFSRLLYKFVRLFSGAFHLLQLILHGSQLPLHSASLRFNSSECARRHQYAAGANENQ